ncbi:unnamed protein product [Vitrella brassicaformis CCMP3155]|uniref:FAD-binding FR-type domain-containing protein n=1 Tax=Vitrella brassicaformis (strain CCMP3155) TaxID=1169540 RepID=A0A0G4EWD1_VITBC|nr:unnamed protein product [Vitrella brassicaformis CCMP3155]|eukprot:CEM02763.1 unnamed protein product [Vitrella brassicaformis CCMP3155]
MSGRDYVGVPPNVQTDSSRLPPGLLGSSRTGSAREYYGGLSSEHVWLDVVGKDGKDTKEAKDAKEAGLDGKGQDKDANTDTKERRDSLQLLLRLQSLLPHFSPKDTSGADALTPEAREEIIRQLLHEACCEFEVALKSETVSVILSVLDRYVGQISVPREEGDAEGREQAQDQEWEGDADVADDESPTADRTEALRELGSNLLQFRHGGTTPSAPQPSSRLIRQLSMRQHSTLKGDIDSPRRLPTMSPLDEGRQDDSWQEKQQRRASQAQQRASGEGSKVSKAGGGDELTAWELSSWVGHNQRGEVFVKLSLTVLSTAALVGYGPYFLTQPKKMEMFGLGLFFARGAAMALMILSGILVITMCRGVLTAFRCTWLGRRCAVLLDMHREFHIFAGELIVVFTVIHVAAHTGGTVPSLSSTTDTDGLNEAINNGKFDEPPSYLDLVLSLPGWTGVVLTLIIVAMTVTSLPSVRHKYFEVFWYPHAVLIWVYFIFMCLHGMIGFLNWGWPLSLVIMGPAMCCYLGERLLRQWRYFTWDVRVKWALVPKDETVVFLTLFKPRQFSYKCGQVVWMSCPAISWFEWHPMSICSHPQTHDSIRLMIGNAGDWTDRFISLCHEANLAVTEERGQFGAPVPFYPPVRLDGPYGAPAQFSVYQENVVFVGAGTGIAAFLGFLHAQFSRELSDHFEITEHGTPVRADPHKRKFRKAHFFWISRKPTGMAWIAEEAVKLVEDPQISSHVTLHICLTAKKPPPPPHIKLFLLGMQAASREITGNGRGSTASLRGSGSPLLHAKNSKPTGPPAPAATGKETSAAGGGGAEKGRRPSQDEAATKIQALVRAHRARRDVLADPPLHVKFGRPQFDVEFRKVCRAVSPQAVKIFACAGESVCEAMADTCIRLRKEGFTIEMITESFG